MKNTLLFPLRTIIILLLLKTTQLYANKTYSYFTLTSRALKIEDSSNGDYSIHTIYNGSGDFVYHYQIKKKGKLFHKSKFWNTNPNIHDFYNINKETNFSQRLEGGKWGWEQYHLKLIRTAGQQIGLYELVVKHSNGIDEEFNKKFPDPLIFYGDFAITQFHGILTSETGSNKYNGILIEKPPHYKQPTVINVINNTLYFNGGKGNNFDFKTGGEVYSHTSGIEHGWLEGVYSVVSENFKLPKTDITKDGELSLDVESSNNGKVWKKESTIKIKEDSEIKFFRLKINK